MVPVTSVTEFALLSGVILTTTFELGPIYF